MLKQKICSCDWILLYLVSGMIIIRMEKIFQITLLFGGEKE